MPTVELVGAPAAPQVSVAGAEKDARADGALFGQLMEQGAVNAAPMLVKTLLGTFTGAPERAEQDAPDTAPQEDTEQTPDAGLALVLAGLMVQDAANVPQQTDAALQADSAVTALPTLGENAQTAQMPAQTQSISQQEGNALQPKAESRQAEVLDSAESIAGAAVFEKITQTVAQAAQSAAGQGKSEQGEGGQSTPLPKERISEADAMHQPLTPFVHIPGEPSVAELETMEKTQAVHTALDRLTEDLQQLRATPTELQLTLEPQRLGTLTISLTMTERGLSAHIKTADREISELIGAQLGTLTDGLRDKGVTLDHVEVSYESLAQQNGQSGKGQSFQGGRQQQEQSTFDRLQHQERFSVNPERPVFADAAAGWSQQGAVEYRV